jgi:hypothetical protein
MRNILIEEDVWEDDPAKLIGRPDIITTLMVRCTSTGVACHLHVRAENRTYELPSALPTVDKVRDWLQAHDTAKYFTDGFGLEDSDALALRKHWGTRFTEPLERWGQCIAS